jgi:hypothetical protein
VKSSRRHKPLPSRPDFARRLLKGGVIGVVILAVSLGAGMCGYHFLIGLAWIDALLNASMILTGMGPVAPVTTDAGKIFASIYALFSGVVFLAASGVAFAPVVHRFLHRFHLETERDAADS